MIYLDSCLVIYLVESPTRSGAVRQALLEAADTPVAISPLVVLECLVGPLRSDDEPLQRRYERVLDPLTLLTMGVAVYERAARIRARHGLRTPDALHLATAIEHGCDELWTNDDRLLGAAGGLARRIGAERSGVIAPTPSRVPDRHG